MKRILMIAVLTLPLALGGCLGHTSRDNEAVGQVKRVHNNTPLLCPDYKDVDISLGVMRNGVGSMSTQDKWFFIQDDAQAALHAELI